MVKVLSPCMSLDASGSLAGSITFSKWKGRNYVRQLVRPSNPQSPGQTSNRAMMKYLTQYWATIGASPQGTWQTPADAMKVSPFNAYVRQNQRDWQSVLAPLFEYQDDRSDGDPLAPAVTATGGIKRADLVIEGAASDNGAIIYRKTGSAPTGIKAEVVAVIALAGATPANWADTNLDAATYHYKVATFTGNSAIGALSTDDAAVVT